MLKNNLKIVFRIVRRRPVQAAINVIGLSMGLTACIFIWMYVSYEQSYDRFHHRSDDIYRVQYDAYHKGEKLYSSATAFPLLGSILKDEFNQIEETTRLFLMYGGHAVSADNKAVNSNRIYVAEQSFFELFDFPIIQGNSSRLLESPGQAVISEAMALKLFDGLDILGETIIVDSGIKLVVTGVVKNPANSHMKFDVLMSYPTGVRIWGDEFENSWGWQYFHVYLRIEEGSNPDYIDQRLPEIVAKYGGSDEKNNTSLSLQKLEDIHLKSDLIHEFDVNNSAENVLIIFMAGIATLVLAWINYINLSSANALTRVKEIGIKKINGANRSVLIRQFLTESLLLTTVAVLLAILLVDLFMPSFNQLIDGVIDWQLLAADYKIWMIFLILFLAGSLLAAFFPALLLSSYDPRHIIKGDFKHSRSGLKVRRFLIVLQYSISSILIGGMLIAYAQLSYMSGRKLGVDIDNTLIVNSPVIFENDSTYFAHLDVFRNELQNLAKVKSISTSSEIPGNIIYFWAQPAIIDSKDDENKLLYTVDVDDGYLEAFGHQLLTGRSFSSEQDESQHLILTEKAVEVSGFLDNEDALGRKIYIEDYDTCTVIGVVSDYHQQGMQKDYSPIAFYCDPEFHLYYSIKFHDVAEQNTLAEVENIYKSFFPGNPFDYFFLNSIYDKHYHHEIQFSRVFSIFSILSMIVASIGLFGLAMVSVGQQTKQIGIRKVLGANLFDLLNTLSKEFILLIVLANIISIPIIYYGGGSWLSRFAYRVEISPIIFLISFIATLLVALLTVSYHTIKTAIKNPVHSLRNE